LGGVGFLGTPGVGGSVAVGLFYPTPTQEAQLIHFLHRTPTVGILN